MSDLPKRVYWDACAWLGYINREAERHANLKTIWDLAERGEFEIWTSAYIHLEVHKAKSQGGDPYPPEESDQIIDALLEQPHVMRVQIDVEIAKLARDLRRSHGSELKQKADAIHLATAVYHNVEELHTYDKSDLLSLNGKVQKQDGTYLHICIPDPLAGTPLFGAASVGSRKDESESEPETE